MRTARLFHFSEKPLGKLRPAPVQDASLRSAYFAKPRGLWVTPPRKPGDLNWEGWCKAEGFGTGRLVVKTEVFLTPSANILRINTDEEFMAFHEAYKYDYYARNRAVYEAFTFRTQFGIDWERVAQDYDGIIIAPYNHRRWGDETSWYYAWDCASGCIWNTQVILRTKIIRDSRPLKAAKAA